MRVIFVCVCSVMLSIATIASAQEIPNQVLPGTIDKRFEVVPEALSSQNIIIPRPGSQMAPDKAERTTFTLRSVSLTGNSVFSEAALSSYYQSYIGTEVSLATMFAVTNAMTSHYAEAGYALSLVYLPEQRITKDGIIRFVVVEGEIDEIIYTGDVDALSDRLRGQLNKLMEESPITVATMERYLLLANDTPGLSVTTALDRADEGVGKIKLLIDVEHTQYNGFAGINNRGSKAIGPVMGDIATVYNMAGPIDGSVTAVVNHTIESNEMGYYSLSASSQINGEGTVIDVSIARVTAAPGITTLRTLEFFTNSWIGSIGVSHSLIRSRTNNATLWGQLDFKDSKGEMLGISFSDEKIRSLRFGGSYDWVTEGGVLTYIQGRISKGIGALGATKNGAETVNRFDADFTYTSFKVDAYQVYQFDHGVDLTVKATVQISLDPLLGSEQCGYGGGQFGRAFDSFEISGDNCLLTSAELKKDLPDFIDVITSVQPYAFWDMGKITLNNSDITAFAQSIGAGVRAKVFNKFDGYVELTVPLNQNVAINGNRKPRLFMGLRSFF